MSSVAVQPAYPVSRDHYPQQPTSQQAAPTAARKQSTRSSNANSPNTPTQSFQPSPTVSNTSNMTTPRAQPQPLSNNASPRASPTLNSPLTTGPPVPPPRTSSHHRTPTASSPIYETHSTPRSAHANTAYDQREPQSASSASRRRPVPAPKDTSMSSREQSSVESSQKPPMGSDLPRDNSTVLNRLVITDPEEDAAREQARVAESRPLPTGADITPITGLSLVGSEGVDDGGRGAAKTRERRKEIKFGEYVLGQTLGEGEFGKVKMGWKRDGGAQVAIKLIRRESLGSNPSRLPKIYREIAILRGLEHPNIVRLHEMVETERHIGIILEYASGGELFDYILQHRYLKDNSARRLFAQLVSGVGYLHKKGIVHRDLKLENLLLDRNRNIIITDFGFANTFNSDDDLGDEMEYGLTSKDFVKKMGLNHVGEDGHRRGDLMQTSCGSPCYAAPELVVSDSLYTGRKVDVWSCGVILYAMLAGYLPFDDDPANPEGDNINLLYKYIVSTPLTFPEYVTPHARDLLKRILVPDPRKRADLFEVARHSWLTEYAHVVGFITSSTTTPNDIANTTVSQATEPPSLARSASVREPPKPHVANPAVVGGLIQKHGQVDQAAQQDKTKSTRETKRRTVQVEYVAPQSSTTRGDGSHGKTRARSGSQGPVEVAPVESYSRTSAVPSGMAPPTRPGRDQQRSASEIAPQGSNAAQYSSQRPSTGGSLSGTRLPSHGNSYGQPAVAVAKEQAQGRISQPRLAQYNVSSPLPAEEGRRGDRRSYMAPGEYDPSAIGFPDIVTSQEQQKPHGHKRSNTVSGLGEKLFGKRGSFFGGRTDDEEKPRKQKKSHPPVSMTKPLPNDNSQAEPRRSGESRRTSFSFSRKNTTGQEKDSSNRTSRRFSFIPSFVKTADKEAEPRSKEPRPRMAFGRGESRSPSGSTSTIPVLYDSNLDRPRDVSNRTTQSQPHPHRNPQAHPEQYSSQPTLQYPANPDVDYYSNHAHDRDTPTPPVKFYGQHGQHQYADQQHNIPHNPQYPTGFNTYENMEDYRPPTKHSVLQKRRGFNEAYESESRHDGSSGAARRVMDFFRKRARARTEA